MYLSGYMIFGNFVFYLNMAKNKLAKFADMAEYPNVLQYAYEQLEEGGFPLKGRWHEDYFKNDGPIVVELGCGRGEYTVGLARRYPEKNFIGFDIKGARMWTGATEAIEEGLHNVAFVRTHIELIERFFAPGEVSEVWITFADPQMKKASKRLTSTLFLGRYQNIMKDGGLIHLKSDSNFLFTYTEEVAKANELRLLACTRNLYNDESLLAEGSAVSPADVAALREIQTYYEQQWRARGIDIKYLCMELKHHDQWQEPEVEIELDEYRSYGRSKRSELMSHA